jgi:hypothetical protein
VTAFFNEVFLKFSIFCKRALRSPVARGGRVLGGPGGGGGGPDGPSEEEGAAVAGCMNSPIGGGGGMLCVAEGKG